MVDYYDHIALRAAVGNFWCASLGLHDSIAASLHHLAQRVSYLREVNDAPCSQQFHACNASLCLSIHA